MAVLTRILEVRPSSELPAEAVVDAAIAEVPENHAYPHRIFLRQSDGGEWVLLRPGWGRLLGRSCMERDILATDVRLPHGLEPGDLLAIADAGAYDRSKSYVFGRG
jgi:diaminopimelate decarboxylase